jgi:hypothetical protein
MIDLGNLAHTLGLRRKKSTVERLQDIAEDAFDSVMDRVRPGKPSPMARMSRMGDSLRNIDLPEMRLPEIRVPDVKMPDVHMPDFKMPDVRMPTMRMPDVHLPDVRFPELHAGERLGNAAGKVRHRAAATGDAAAGVATGIGGFFGAIFSGLWSLVTFAVKASILAGIAYAGWQYLQGRKTQQSWSGSPGATSSPSYPSSMYGSVTPEPAAAR